MEGDSMSGDLNRQLFYHLHLAAAMLALLVTVPSLVSWFLVERTRPSDVIYWVLVPGLMLFAFLQILHVAGCENSQFYGRIQALLII